MNCPKCNAPIIVNGTYDREADFLPSSNNQTTIVSSGRYARLVYTCSNEECDNHDVLLNADGSYFNIAS